MRLRYGEPLFTSPTETALHHLRYIGGDDGSEDSRCVFHVGGHQGLDGCPCSGATHHLEAHQAVILGDIGKRHIGGFSCPVECIGYRGVSKLRIGTAAGIGITTSRGVVIGAIGSLNVHAAMRSIVVGSVHTPVFFYHFIGIIIMIDKESVGGDILIPSRLLTILYNHQLTSGACLTLGLTINISGGIGGEGWQLHILGLVE